MSIKAGDFVGVGGAFCVAPTVCDFCGEPATLFEGHGSGRSARVDGYCRSCRDWLAALAAWEEGLDDEDSELIEDLEYEIEDHLAAEFADLEPEDVEAHKAMAGKCQRSLEEIYRRTNRPPDPRVNPDRA